MLVIELHGELSETRVIAGRSDAAEIACIAGNDLPVCKEACCGYGVEVANRVGEVNMVEARALLYVKESRRQQQATLAASELVSHSGGLLAAELVNELHDGSDAVGVPT